MFYRLISIALLVVVLLASLAASVKSWVETGLQVPLKLPSNGYILDVQAGSSLSQLSRDLYRKGLIDSPYPLLIYSRAKALSQIHVGAYQLTPGENAYRLIEKLLAGDVIRFQITFPEGRTLAQWLEVVNQHEVLAKQSTVDLKTLASEFEAPWGENLEGWFFPDTYSFTSSDSAIGVFRQAHDKMIEVLAQEWNSRSDGLPLQSPYEALILASIIEKETGLARERPAIAGVFVRRLQRGMKLQTDPTVIYGLGENFDGNLTRAHLRQDNPYNTYVIARLPPTPIANPGRESIHAALHPQPGTEVFFVARGDGSHQFSNTLAEHRRAVRQYQLRRVENYRSAPE